jgi:hypothetical protein
LSCCSDIRPEDVPRLGTIDDYKKLVYKGVQTECSSFLSEMKNYGACRSQGGDGGKTCIEEGKTCGFTDECCGDLKCDDNTLEDTICRRCSEEYGTCKQTKDCCKGLICSVDEECYVNDDDE